jgi:hypothetical protein
LQHRSKRENAKVTAREIGRGHEKSLNDLRLFAQAKNIARPSDKGLGRLSIAEKAPAGQTWNMNAAIKTNASTSAAAKREAALEAAQRSGKDWRRVFGWAAGDPLHAEAVKLGAQYRQNQQIDHAHS